MFLPGSGTADARQRYLNPRTTFHSGTDRTNAMPFVPVPFTVLAEIRQQQDGQLVENTLYFRSDSAWTAASATAMANDLVTWWAVNMAPLVSSSVLLREIVLTDLASQTGFQVTATPAALTTGAAGSEQTPNHTSIAISFRTEQRGRSFRGRNYIIGLHDAIVDKNIVVESALDDFVAAYQALFTPTSTNACTWVVVSRFSGVDPVTDKPIPRAVGLTTPVTSVLFADNVVDTQSRRGPKRGK
jgi:hypothetical protein